MQELQGLGFRASGLEPIDLEFRVQGLKSLVFRV